MPKTRRRAGDRTAGADWQRGCLIDRAEGPGFYKFCAKGPVGSFSLLTGRFFVYFPAGDVL